MGKTLFSDGNPSLGQQGTIVSAAFLNAIFAHRHDGADADGSAPINYAADTGAANACAIALAPALTALVIGMPVRFKAAYSNTGASSLAVNGLAGVAIKKLVNQALEGGDIVAGQVVEVIFDGTYWQLMTTNVFQSRLLGYLANPGWQKLPNGLILQWGSYVALNTGETTITITFPLTFPAACFVPVVSPIGDNGSYDMFPDVANWNQSIFNVFLQWMGSPTFANSGGFTWMAIGY